jgi:hypothetical protein
MTAVRFDLQCEGDIEKFSKWSRERVLAKKQTDVVLSVPNLHWPPMVIEILVQAAADDPDSDEVYMNVDFDIKYVDPDMVVTEDDLSEMLDDMTEEELKDWISDMLSEFESEKDDEEDQGDDQ